LVLDRGIEMIRLWDLKLIKISIVILQIGLIANSAGDFLLSSDDAMTVCQLSHSYDTCFQAMNR